MIDLTRLDFAFIRLSMAEGHLYPCTLSLLALHLAIALHEFAQFLDNSHAKSCTLLSVHGIGPIGLKHMRHLFFRHARSGILDQAAETHPVIFQILTGQGQVDLTGFGKFDRIGDHILQDLPHMFLIPNDCLRDRRCKTRPTADIMPMQVV